MLDAPGDRAHVFTALRGAHARTAAGGAPRMYSYSYVCSNSYEYEGLFEQGYYSRVLYSCPYEYEYGPRHFYSTRTGTVINMMTSANIRISIVYIQVTIFNTFIIRVRYRTRNTFPHHPEAGRSSTVANCLY